MAWSENIWRQAQPHLQAITGHPFVTTLMNGTLLHEIFTFYVRQDTIYLSECGKALSAIATRLDKPEDTAAFLHFASSTLSVERALHQSFLSSHPATPVRPSPSCLLYTSYIQRQAALAPVEVAVASILPCFAVYKYVGEFILARGTSQDNPYQRWINTYNSDDFGQAVKQATTIADTLAEQSAHMAAMNESFIACVEMEWMFWDSAWQQESWPL